LKLIETWKKVETLHISLSSLKLGYATPIPRDDHGLPGKIYDGNPSKIDGKNMQKKPCFPVEIFRKPIH